MFLENTLQVQLVESLAFFIMVQKSCRKRADLKKQSQISSEGFNPEIE